MHKLRNSVLLTYGNAQLTLWWLEQPLKRVCFELMKKPQLLCCLLACKAWCILQILHGLWNVCVLSWCKGPQHLCGRTDHSSNTGMACEMCMFWVNVRDHCFCVVVYLCMCSLVDSSNTGMACGTYTLWGKDRATYSFCVIVYLPMNTVMLNALFKHWNGLWNIYIIRKGQRGHIQFLCCLLVCEYWYSMHSSNAGMACGTYTL